MTGKRFNVCKSNHNWKTLKTKRENVQHTNNFFLFFDPIPIAIPPPANGALLVLRNVLNANNIAMKGCVTLKPLGLLMSGIWWSFCDRCWCCCSGTCGRLRGASWPWYAPAHYWAAPPLWPCLRAPLTGSQPQIPARPAPAILFHGINLICRSRLQPVAARVMSEPVCSDITLSYSQPQFTSSTFYPGLLLSGQSRAALCTPIFYPTVWFYWGFSSLQEVWHPPD